MKHLKYIIPICAILFIVGCRELDVEPPAADPVPPTLPALGDSINLSATIDGQNIQFVNKTNSEGNAVDSSWMGFCSSVALGELKSQMMYFGVFADTNQRAQLIIEQRLCRSSLDSLHQDSIFMPGSHNYVRLGHDTGIVVTWVDDTLRTWSSALSLDTSYYQNSTFTISERAINLDGYSEYLVTGSFDCWLFDDLGDSLRMTSNGSFYSRAGRYW